LATGEPAQRVVRGRRRAQRLLDVSRTAANRSMAQDAGQSAPSLAVHLGPLGEEAHLPPVSLEACLELVGVRPALREPSVRSSQALLAVHRLPGRPGLRVALRAAQEPGEQPQDGQPRVQEMTFAA
jgi:hypothetical protein